MNMWRISIRIKGPRGEVKISQQIDKTGNGPVIREQIIEGAIKIYEALCK